MEDTSGKQQKKKDRFKVEDFESFMSSFLSAEEEITHKIPFGAEEKKTLTADSILSNYRVKRSLTLMHLFEEVLNKNASDLHISCGSSPVIRVHGEFISTPYQAVIEENIKELVFPILSPEQIESFNKYGDLDFSYEEPGIARFRVNIYKKLDGMGAAFRLIPNKIPRFEDLGLPSILKEISDYKSGLVLITGPTGSGKTTTLASIVDQINMKRRGHIITIEDPLEFVHENKMSTITHREIGNQAIGFGDAIRSAMRSDPDVILVGEMRDYETVSEALRAAETGILVLSTLHTNNAAKAVDRLIDLFPPENQMQARTILGGVLKAVVAQRLLKRMDKKGRVPAVEVLFATSGLDNLIREGKTILINSVIQTGREEGMKSMDQALIELIENNIIDKNEAKEIAVDYKTFERAGIIFD